MSFTEFLSLVKVVRMLHGREVAIIFFKNNIAKFYQLNYDDISASIKRTESENQ